jgi:hypothetical protein
MQHGSGSQPQVTIQVRVVRGFFGELNNYEKSTFVSKLKENVRKNVIFEIMFINFQQTGAITF